MNFDTFWIDWICSENWFYLFGAEGQTFTLADLASEYSSRYSLRWTAQRPVDSLDFRRIDGHRQWSQRCESFWGLNLFQVDDFNFNASNPTILPSNPNRQGGIQWQVRHPTCVAALLRVMARDFSGSQHVLQNHHPGDSSLLAVFFGHADSGTADLFWVECWPKGSCLSSVPRNSLKSGFLRRDTKSSLEIPSPLAQFMDVCFVALKLQNGWSTSWAKLFSSQPGC